MTKQKIYDIITFFNKKHNKKEILDRYILVDFHIFYDYDYDYAPLSYIYLVYDKKEKKHKYAHIEFRSNENYYNHNYEYCNLEEFIERSKKDNLYDFYKIDLDKLQNMETITQYLRILKEQHINNYFYFDLLNIEKIFNNLYLKKEKKEIVKKAFYYNSFIIDFYIKEFMAYYYIENKEEYFEMRNKFYKDKLKAVDKRIKKLFKMKQEI